MNVEGPYRQLVVPTPEQRLIDEQQSEILRLREDLGYAENRVAILSLREQTLNARLLCADSHERELMYRTKLIIGFIGGCALAQYLVQLVGLL